MFTCSIPQGTHFHVRLLCASLTELVLIYEFVHLGYHAVAAIMGLAMAYRVFGMTQAC